MINLTQNLVLSIDDNNIYKLNSTINHFNGNFTYSLTDPFNFYNSENKMLKGL